jgi:ABC-2 type transport system permease protein
MSPETEPAARRSPRKVTALQVLLALLARDLRVIRRELVSYLVRTTAQPLLFVVVFGYMLSKMGFLREDYNATLLPGILAVSLALASLQSMVLPLAMDFGWSREIDDRLLAPVGVQVVVLQKVLSATLQGLIAALFVLPLARWIMGPIPGLSFADYGSILVVTVLGSMVFSTLGLLMGTAVQPQQIGLLFSVVLTPMVFFGCAYYPWSGLDALPTLKYAVLVNPLVYVAEGMRAALTPDKPHMSFPVVVGALVLLNGLFWWVGARSFERRAFG